MKTPEQLLADVIVALGWTDTMLGLLMSRKQLGAPGLRPPAKPIPPGETFDYQGKRLSIGDLAKLAGTSWTTMQFRLKTRDAEAAVAMGPADRGRGGRAGAEKRRQKITSLPATLRLTASETAGLQPTVVAQLSKPAQATIKRAEFNGREAEARDVVLAKAQEPIIPDNVKRTVAPTPRGRFEIDAGLMIPVFGAMKPGEYLKTDSVVSRSYGRMEETQ